MDDQEFTATLYMDDNIIVKKGKKINYCSGTIELVDGKLKFTGKQKSKLNEIVFDTNWFIGVIGISIVYRKTRLERDKKFKEGKMVIFRYNPEEPREANEYKFANTSGNPIRTPKNLKVTPYVYNQDLFNKLKRLD